MFWNSWKLLNLLFYLFLLCPFFLSGKVFTFEDTNLEYIVEKAIHKAGSPLQLKILKGDGGGIESDLAGLERFSNLEVISLADNRIYGFDSLTQLKKLRYLDLSSNLIVDISSLGKIKSLKYLALSSNQIKNIDSLAELSNLEHLEVASNFIEDIRVLGKLKKLKYLDISFNPIKPELLYVIGKLRELEYLNISGIKGIRDFSFLSQLKHLKTLEMEFLDLSEIPSEIKNLPLRKLNLNYNHISKLKNLPPSLEELHLNFNNISSLVPLIFLTPKLKVLSVRYNKIKDFSPLKILLLKHFYKEEELGK